MGRLRKEEGCRDRRAVEEALRLENKWFLEEPLKEESDRSAGSDYSQENQLSRGFTCRKPF